MMIKVYKRNIIIAASAYILLLVFLIITRQPLPQEEEESTEVDESKSVSGDQDPAHEEPEKNSTQESSSAAVSDLSPAESTLETTDIPSAVDDRTASQNGGENIHVYITAENEYVEYSSREDFLQAFHFDSANPILEYYNMDGNLAMELFYDEVSKKGCGIRYYYSKPASLFATLGMRGFVFEGVSSAEWEEPDKFSTTSIHGSTGADDPFIENYEETLRLNENGKPEYFFSQGDVTYLGGEQPQPLIEISFTYREDGTLLHRKYHHNMGAFATYSSTRDCFYDKEERLIFEDIYHTHGSNEYYYLYSDGSSKPTYALYLDNIAGTWVAELFQYD